MFSFMKKSGAEKEERERRKKEKKDRKESKKRDKGSMSAEELLRLDEVRRSLKIGGRRKEKEKLPSGITADYTASFFAGLDYESDISGESSGFLNHHLSSEVASVSSLTHGEALLQSDSSEASMTSLNTLSTHIACALPPLPPKPPKRGILKSTKVDITLKSDKVVSNNNEIDSNVLVISSTLKNKVITVPSVCHFSADKKHVKTDLVEDIPDVSISKHAFDDTNKGLCMSSPEYSRANSEILPSLGTSEDDGVLATPSMIFEPDTNKLTIITSTSPSADSLTDTTTNSSFVTPPFSLSPVGENQGFRTFNSHCSSYSGNIEDLTMEFPLPQLIPLLLPPPRIFTIQHHSSREDFGLSLQSVVTRNHFGNGEQVVILVEPCEMLRQMETGFLPGDYLLEINGMVVNGQSREDVIDIIKSSGTAVTIKVQSLPEMLEIIQQYVIKISNSEEDTNFKGSLSCYSEIHCFKKASSEEQYCNEQSWMVEAEQLWLVHQKGFTTVRQLSNECAEDFDSGRIQIRVEMTGNVFTVDDGNVEKANPPQFNYVEDVAQLPYLNESSILHTLRQRFANHLTYTYAGNMTIFINPMAPLAIYSEKVMHLFCGHKAEEMPPHIYAVAQTAYQNMLTSRQDQAIIMLGRSGSGKTTNFKQVVHYLMLAAGTVNKVLTVEKFNALSVVLEAFGNAKTVINLNATRFTQILSIDFDQSGQISSAYLKVLLLESSRIIHRLDGEQVFHIFYLLLAGADRSLRNQLKLDAESNEPNLFITPFQKEDDKHRAMEDFKCLCTAFKVLDVTDAEMYVIWSVLASIYHLGFAGATKAVNSSSVYQFANPQAAHHAASLLGIKMEELSYHLFDESISTKSSLSKDRSSIEILGCFVVGLYKEVFCAVAALINRSISTTLHTVSSLLLIDYPGFQNPASCGYQKGAGLQDLCHNYLQERLYMLFQHTVLVVPQNRYIQEKIDFSFSDSMECEPSSNLSVVSLLDRNVHSVMLYNSQTDLHEMERRGLFWLLNEEALSSEGSDTSFLDRLFTYSMERDYQTLLQKAPGNNQFVLHHMEGTNPVLYTVCGWLKFLQENLVMCTVASLLQESSIKEVRKLFLYVRYQEMQSIVADRAMGIGERESFQRPSSIQCNFTLGSGNLKGKTYGVQVKITVDAIIELLHRTKCSFVNCFLPHHNAGLRDLQSNNGLKRTATTATANETCINIPLIRSQLRGSQILNAVRLYKQGFPSFLPLSEFRRLYSLLAPVASDSTNAVLSEKKVVENIMSSIDIDSTLFRIGLSQIFFRSGVLTHLQSLRDEKLADNIVRLQTFCRRYLMFQKLARLKVQDLAVRCIQRNVRIFFSVRDWPWWRLLMKVTPLLNVHRLEEELKMKTEEVEALQTKVKKLEQAHVQLQQRAERLETKLSHVTSELADEHSTVMLLSEHLESESAEKLRLEKELQEVQLQNRTLNENTDHLEMELLHFQAAGMDDDMSNTNDESSVSIYKGKFQKVVQELETTRRRLQQQHENDLEQLISLKKQHGKKLRDAYTEVEELMKKVAQWKCKVQKLSAENSDLRIVLEEQTARNALLEKKQRKFDSELQHLQDEFHQEKQQRERVSREKELALAEKFNVEQELKSVQLELEGEAKKIKSLVQQFEEFSLSGKSEAEIVQLKKLKHDLEKKLKDQEEELDDMAGQIQLLEQAKLRLEMNLEQIRKEHRREMVQRDEEFEDIRCNAHKKVKALEVQLEYEHEKRTHLLREKHDFERRIVAMEEEARNKHTVEEDQLQRLRRDLRRTKALLHDAQTMLQRMRNDAPSKAFLRQLRNQLEDAEFSRSTAMKAKQSADMELAEVQTQLEEANLAKTEAEERAIIATREQSDARLQLEENEEELAVVLKKYHAAVEQLSLDQATITEHATLIAALENERMSLREQVAEMSSRLENAKAFGDATSSLAQKKVELQVIELQTKLDLEQTTRSRLEIQISRLKDSSEKLQNENIMLQNKEHTAQDQLRRLQKTVHELHDKVACAEAHEAETNQKHKDLEKRFELAESEGATALADLRLALKRIEDLQFAIQGEMEGDSDSEHGSSTSNQYSDQSDDVVSYCSTSMENT